MRKYLYVGIVFIVAFFLVLQAKAQALQGDAKTACEVILCLSSGERPQECAAPIAKFFSIKGKKPSDTLNLRKSFLGLCPVSGTDQNMHSLTDLIANQHNECSAEYLNTFVEKELRLVDFEQVEFIRIAKQLPSHCEALKNHQYTDLNLKYICSGDFYHAEEWHKGKTAKGDKIKKDCWK